MTRVEKCKICNSDNKTLTSALLNKLTDQRNISHKLYIRTYLRAVHMMQFYQQKFKVVSRT